MRGNELLQKVKWPDRTLSAGTVATLQDFNLLDQDGKVSDAVAATVDDLFHARVDLFDAKYCGSKDGVTPDAETVQAMQSMGRLFQSSPNLWNEFLSKAKDPPALWSVDLLLSFRKEDCSTVRAIWARMFVISLTRFAWPN